MRLLTYPHSSFLSIILLATSPLLAHDPPGEHRVRFSAPAGEVGAALLLPEAHGKVPCVVIAGGTLSHTRDGGFEHPKAPPRDALRRLALALAEGGYASLRYDKLGRGESKPNAHWKGTYSDEAQALAAAIAYARGREEVQGVAVAGESAGGYVACLAAKDGALADAYVFLGAHSGPAEEIYEYNFGRLAEYAASSEERRRWVEAKLRYELALGRHYGRMFDAAREGKDSVEVDDGGFKARFDGLERRREELRLPPGEMFRHLRGPVLALAGERDLNVRPAHAEKIVRVLAAAGNPHAVAKTIPGADHSFQVAPEDEDQRFRERYSFASFQNPYAPELYEAVLEWLAKTLPAAAPRPAARERLLAIAAGGGQPKAGGPQIIAKTETTPERVHLAPGVQVIDDITDRSKQAAVDTLEGRIGPLILAEGSQSHFIDMPAGMFVAEHAHSTESIIYTVRGRWVLCTQGQRRVMNAGSLFTFGRNVSTGYEVPFDADAYILIFKGDRLSKSEGEFIEYLRGMAKRLEKEETEGVPYKLKSLPQAHPAIEFARRVNPEFVRRLGQKTR
jgi:pimeloyl-ACP methyl ester carboxylesterase/quercetin dioxygenase-like cupin family protein